MSKETLAPPLPPIDARTEAVAERLFGLKWALRKDSTEIIHEEWQTAPEWIHDGYLRQAIEVLATADQAQPASADGSDYEERMRVEYRELTARAGRLRGMLQRYADGTLDFEPVCPISLLSRQLDVMDEYANLLRHRAKIEHVHLEKTGLRHRINKEPDLPAGLWHYHKPDYHAGGNRTNERTKQRIPTNHHQHHNKHQPNNTSARRCVPRLRRRMRCRRHHVREMRWADARLAAGISIMVGFAA